MYKQVRDFQLNADVNRSLYQDAQLKCDDCVLDVAAFNGDLLLVGHVPTPGLRNVAISRVRSVHGYRRLFIQILVRNQQNSTLEDGWITAKIRSQIVADSSINPKQFKVVTSDGVVYLMGDVIPAQATRVIRIARKTSGVKKVVKLFKYYHLSNRPSMN